LHNIPPEICPKFGITVRKAKKGNTHISLQKRGGEGAKPETKVHAQLLCLQFIAL
jgi:hypothetical protein